MNTKKWLLASAFVAPTAMLSAPASAQSIDYGSLEMLFDEPVTTSATGAPQRATDAPVTMEIISSQDIRNSGESDLAGVLSRVVGVNTQSFSRGSTDVAVRGYNSSFSPRLLVLVNGRQVYLDHFGYTQWNAIPVQLEEIRQIEVVKGPNTALFGFNAVDGVVNIITFNPLYDDADTANIRVDDDGGYQGSLVATFKPHEKIGARISAGGFSVDEYDGAIANPNYPDGGDTARKTAAGEVMFQIASKVQASLEATYANIDPFEQVPNMVQSTIEYETTSFKGALEAEGGWGLFKLTAYQNELDYFTVTEAGPIENTLQVV